MATTHKHTLASTIGVGKLLFSSLASSAGKSQLGVTYLNLEMTPASAVQLCYSDKAEVEPGKLIANDVTVVIDSATTSTVQMNFVVGDLLPGNQDYVVFLAYSTSKTSTPPLLTPRSDNKLLLDLNGLEVIGAYAFPKLSEYTQDVTRVGQAQSKARQKFLFTVNLSNDSIPALIRSGQNKIYLQAMSVPKSDYDRGIFDNALLTKVNSISFGTPTVSGCAPVDASLKIDTSGGKTVKPMGNTSSTFSKSGTTASTGVITGKSSKSK